jgi:hypothetical protein
MGNCVMTSNGQPLPGSVEGVPMTRLVVLPAHRWQIEDTWHATGLKGSGSHHVVLRDALIPDANFVDLDSGASCLPGPLYAAPMHFIPLMHGPIAVGIAEGALSDIVDMAGSGWRQLRASRAMRDTELFRAELGQAQAEFRAAKAYLQMQTTSHWSHARTGTLQDDGLMIEGRGETFAASFGFGALMQIMSFVDGLVLATIADRREAASTGLLAAWWGLGGLSVLVLIFVGGHAVNLTCVAAAGFLIMGAQHLLNNFTAGTYDTTVRASGVGMELGMGRVDARPVRGWAATSSDRRTGRNVLDYRRGVIGRGSLDRFAGNPAWPAGQPASRFTNRNWGASHDGRGQGRSSSVPYTRADLGQRRARVASGGPCNCCKSTS